MNHCKNCGNNIPDEVGTCSEAGYGEGCGNKISELFEGENSSLRKTYEEATNTDHLPHGAIKSESLTYTPDTEWNLPKADMLADDIYGHQKEWYERTKVEAILTARDTYWKERVRKGVIKEMHSLNLDEWTNDLLGAIFPKI